MKYKNLLNISANPEINLLDKNLNNKNNTFSDMGAWHGYYLPQLENKLSYGGFKGPLILAQEYPINLSNDICNIELINNINNKKYNLGESKNVKFDYYPGKLYQYYKLDDMTLELELIFISPRSALIKTTIKNNTLEDLDLNINFKGEIFNQYFSLKDNKLKSNKLKLEKIQNGIKVLFSDILDESSFLSNKEMIFEINNSVDTITSIYENSYQTYLNKKIKPKKNFTIYSTQSYTFSKKEYENEKLIIEKVFKNPNSYLKLNSKRWKKYIDIVESKKNISDEYKKVAVKCINTLITNYRSSAGALKHGGITPSFTYHYFNGLWAWDSFKHSVAIADFDVEIAKENIKSIFDYQIIKDDELRPYDEGALIDCIFFNKSTARGGMGLNWNERNSKPPLASWSVYEIYKKSNDIKFLEEMYPKLTRYHNWWYRNRCSGEDAVVSYGAMIDEKNNSEKEIILATTWESGMDNAIRFDLEQSDEYKVKVNKSVDDNGTVIGYTINQESVDLNSYLYKEKLILSKIAKKLGKEKESKVYIEESIKIKNYINQYMYDDETGYYYDIRRSLEKKKLLINSGKGCEGFIPLWANVATYEQAKKVRDNIMDENKFNTFMPIPTVSKNNKKYNPIDYWREPVWLDQALFLIEGLENYGYYQDAKIIAKKLFNNAKGLMEKEPIRENYNPETGEGLNATNFSWSAAAYYNIYKYIL